MLIFPISDLHLGMNKKLANIPAAVEFFDFLPTDEKVVIANAGDTDDRLRGLVWWIRLLNELPENIEVVYTPGNHEFYGANMDILCYDIAQLAAPVSRLHVLDGVYVFNHTIEDVDFIGGTLWTDFNKQSPGVMNAVQRGMNDYNYIRAGNDSKVITTNRILNEHGVQCKEIFKELNKNNGRTKVVITHHQPIEISGGHATDALSYGYFSDLTEKLNECANPPKLWISGHTHNSHYKKMKFTNGETEFVSNQYGYPMEHTTGFSKNCIFKL